VHWTLQGTVWTIGFVLELAIAVVFFAHRLQREFPVFSCYLVLELIRTTVLLAIRPGRPQYFYTYWLSEVLVALFGFLVVEEVFRKAFSKHLGLQQLGTNIFRSALIALVICSVLVAAAAPGNDSDKLVAAILVLKRAQSFVRIGLVFSLFGLVFLLGIPWSGYVVGIATGFALYGTVELATVALRSHFGVVANQGYVWSIMGANLCQKLVWGFYFLRAKAQSPSDLPSSRDHHSPAAAELEKMNEAVETFLRR
jgi:hypothetical protein